MTPQPLPNPPDWQRLLAAPPAASRTSQRVVWLAAASAHILALWGLLQVNEVRQALRQAAPMVVDLISPERPEPSVPPPPAPVPPAAPRAEAIPVPAPVIAAPSPAPVPAESFSVPAPAPLPAVNPVVAAPPAPPAPPTPPQQRKLVAATAVSYAVEPPAELPRASRRAGEHGTVWLRVVVDVRGHPAAVGVQRSSGYARLDENALAAMRQARFRPYTENGQALEVEVVATIEYPQE